MAELLTMPNFQPLDSNGDIIPDGFIYTYVPLTTTPKTTWQNRAESIANTNPIQLDSSGSCLLYGDGAYRLQIYDANMVLVRDQESASWISQAMEAVTDAGTIAAADALLGVLCHGQCRLARTSATQLTLSPYGGNLLIINGQFRTVPAGGVTLSTAGLAINTSYYIYAFMSGSTMTLEASTTTHATSSANGVEIKSGDATRTLVGAAVTDASTQFNDSVTKRDVASWFNRQERALTGAGTAGATTASAALVELASSARVQGFLWADSAATLMLNGYASNDTAPNNVSSSIGRDGAVARLPTVAPVTNISTNNFAAAIPASVVDTGAVAMAGESQHFWTPLGAVGGGTGTFNLALQGSIWS